jgi:hypothetical protein
VTPAAGQPEPAKLSLDRAAELLAAPEQLRHPPERHRHTMVRLRRGERLWSHLEGLGLIYLLGGARENGQIVGPRGRGVDWTDCSGGQIYDLRAMGVQLRAPDGWTGTLVEEGHEGTSPYFTLFLKEPFQTEGHVIGRRRHQPRVGSDEWRWTEVGGFDNPHSGGGAAWFHPTPERIAEFPYHRHFKVLG